MCVCVCVCVCVHIQDNPVTDRKADVIQAAYIASEIAHRMVTVGGEVSHKHAYNPFDSLTVVKCFFLFL